MFRKMKLFLLLLIVSLFCVIPSFAAESTDESVLGNDRWSVQNDGDLIPNTTAAYDIGGASNYVDNAYITTLYTTGYVHLTTPQVGIFSLPLTSFLFENTAAPLSTSSTPGLEIDNVIPNINWADGETSAVQVTFRVPDDYLSGGDFRLLCDSSNASTPEKVDFDVYVNTSGSTWDAAATNQTPVALTLSAGSPETVTLTVATDFSSLVAGKYVTLRLWRDNVSTGTGDLEVSYVSFYYNRK